MPSSIPDFFGPDPPVSHPCAQMTPFMGLGEAKLDLALEFQEYVWGGSLHPKEKGSCMAKPPLDAESELFRSLMPPTRESSQTDPA